MLGSLITITVTTHPGGELDERSIIGDTLVDPSALESGVHTAKELGHTLPDSFVEVAHTVTHFVLWGGLRSPDLISSKGSLNL
jgi:hypothetical protein